MKFNLLFSGFICASIFSTSTALAGFEITNYGTNTIISDCRKIGQDTRIVETLQSVYDKLLQQDTKDPKVAAAIEGAVKSIKRFADRLEVFNKVFAVYGKLELTNSSTLDPEKLTVSGPGYSLVMANVDEAGNFSLSPMGFCRFVEYDVPISADDRISTALNKALTVLLR